MTFQPDPSARHAEHPRQPARNPLHSTPPKQASVLAGSPTSPIVSKGAITLRLTSGLLSDDGAPREKDQVTGKVGESAGSLRAAGQSSAASARAAIEEPRRTKGSQARSEFSQQHRAPFDTHETLGELKTLVTTTHDVMNEASPFHQSMTGRLAREPAARQDGRHEGRQDSRVAPPYDSGGLAHTSRHDEVTPKIGHHSGPERQKSPIRRSLQPRPK